MAGSLSHPNKIKDVYKNLIFYKDSDGKYYRDNGTSDVELVIGGGHTGINNDLSWLKFTTTSTVSSGNLFEVINNSASMFSLNSDGTIRVKGQSSAPGSVSAGQIYYNSSDNALYLGT
tara:strand:- start:376 stop:729 length:354 start_codon:yes stop_codon:yes gene_type:complete